MLDYPVAMLIQDFLDRGKRQSWDFSGDELFQTELLPQFEQCLAQYFAATQRKT
jgi:hypothetical protein